MPLYSTAHSPRATVLRGANARDNAAPVAFVAGGAWIRLCQAVGLIALMRTHRPSGRCTPPGRDRIRDPAASRRTIA